MMGSRREFSVNYLTKFLLFFRTKCRKILTNKNVVDIFHSEWDSNEVKNIQEESLMEEKIIAVSAGREITESEFNEFVARIPQQQQE